MPSVTVGKTNDGRIQVVHEKFRMGADVGSTLVIEMGSAAWLASALDAALDDGFVGAKTSLGGDNLKVRIGGSEMDPVINVDNDRSGAYSFVSLHWPEARQARDRIRQLAGR